MPLKGYDIQIDDSSDDEDVPNVFAQAALAQAASMGDVASLTKAFKNGAHLDLATDVEDGMTALHCAAVGTHTAAVERLLELKASADMQESNGQTPLILACSAGSAAVAEKLLAHNASIDMFDKDGEGALHTACSLGDADLVALLLRHGADATLKSVMGKTPRMLAEEKGHTQCATLIKEVNKTRAQAVIHAKQLRTAEGPEPEPKEPAAAAAESAMDASDAGEPLRPGEMPTPPVVTAYEKQEAVKKAATATSLPAVDAYYKQESVKKAGALKAQGGTAVAKRQWKAAIQCYERAAGLVSAHEMFAWPPNDADDAEAGSLLTACHNNLAMCHLKLEQWGAAVDCASRVLARDEENSKAHYRRGLARLELRDAAGAIDDLQQAGRLEPGSKDVQQAFRRACERAHTWRALAREGELAPPTGEFAPADPPSSARDGAGANAFGDLKPGFAFARPV